MGRGTRPKERKSGAGVLSWLGGGSVDSSSSGTCCFCLGVPGLKRFFFFTSASFLSDVLPLQSPFENKSTLVRTIPHQPRPPILSSSAPPIPLRRKSHRAWIPGIRLRAHALPRSHIRLRTPHPLGVFCVRGLDIELAGCH